MEAVPEFAERPSKRPRSLDCHQECVVQAELDRDLCILAGAGTGKTETMVRRIQRLTDQGWTVRRRLPRY